MVKLAGPSWPIFRGLYVWHLSYYHGPLLLSRGILFQVLLSFMLVMASLYWRISSAQVKQKCWNCGFPFLNQQTDHNSPCIFYSHTGTMFSFPLDGQNASYLAMLHKLLTISVTLLAKPTFCFSCKQFFATFCKEMYGKLARPSGQLG